MGVDLPNPCPVQGGRLVPFGPALVVAIVVGALAPMLPLLVLAIPVDELIVKALKLLLGV